MLVLKSYPIHNQRNMVVVTCHITKILPIIYNFKVMTCVTTFVQVLYLCLCKLLFNRLWSAMFYFIKQM